MSCLSMASSDFYSAHTDYKTKLVLNVRDSNNSVVDAAAAALDLIKDVKVDVIIGPQKSTGKLCDGSWRQGSCTNYIVLSYKPFSHSRNSLLCSNSAKRFQASPGYCFHSESLSMEPAKELGMMSEGYAWIATSGLMDLFNLVDFDVAEAMQGILGVKPLIPNSKELQSFAGRWIRMFLQANQDMKPSETSIFGLWAYDTFTALATAAERVGNSEKNSEMNEDNVNPAGEPFCLGVSEKGPKLLRALLATRFRGLAGEFNLVNGQLEQTPYQIVNVVGRGEREVGIWTPSGGISRKLDPNITSSYSTSKENFRTIIWPGDSTTAPRGWEFPVGGEKLRIGVPQKPGFNEFLKVDRDPQTNATEVSGYYKDIFDSVMASLPYAIRYEYIPYPFFNPDGSRRGNYDDLVYQVSLQDHYDAALGDITITANRSIYADFTLPYAEGGVTCIVPIKYEDVNDVLTFLQPLTKELWLATGAFYISTALAVWILGSRIISSSRDPPGQHAGMFGYFPFFPGEGIQGSLLCLVLVTWAFVASLLNSTYTASLSSRLTVQRLQPTITDVKQLIKNGNYVGCQEALTLGSENGGISAYYDVLPHIRMILSQYCGKYMIIGPTYRTDGFAFAFPKGSPAVADLSRAIIQLTENGTILEIEQRLSSNSACLGPESTSSPTSVTLRSFLVLFVITGCVTLICLLVSLLIHRCKNRACLQISSDFKAKTQSIIHALYQDLKILSQNCKLERK
ncbi:UNVERIFIED_CONTAM: Glutamate receptor 2.8 [Sesamum radiatum]|uniref:Glutamate receptor 2.8 n=1 Tax=Sesamum radiatum TaxID=300843 RepID=A0AAW2VA43_SESRA